MSDESYDGGQAFPRAEGENTPDIDGMTMRQWYQGQALKGLASRLTMVEMKDILEGQLYSALDLAAVAAALAEAMLLEDLG